LASCRSLPTRHGFRRWSALRGPRWSWWQGRRLRRMRHWPGGWLTGSCRLKRWWTPRAPWRQMCRRQAPLM